MSDVPSREQFLQMVERLFGSRSPDLDAFLREVEEVAAETRELADNEAEQRFADTHEELWVVAATCTEMGLQSWDELPDELKKQVMQALSRAEEFADRENYLFRPQN